MRACPKVWKETISSAWWYVDDLHVRGKGGIVHNPVALPGWPDHKAQQQNQEETLFNVKLDNVFQPESTRNGD